MSLNDNSNDPKSQYNFTVSPEEMYSRMTMANAIVNTPVPRYVAGSDIYDFLAEYEMATAGFDEDTRKGLLTKAFPPGQLHLWFEKRIEPLLNSSSYKELRKKIINRFATSVDTDRHFIKFREMKFNPETGQKLYDFVEALFFTYEATYKGNYDVAHCISSLKAAIPAAIKSTLNLMPEYCSANTIDDFLTAIQKYDQNLAGPKLHSPNDKLTMNEMATLMRQMYQDMANMRKEVVALSATRAEDYNRERRNSDTERKSRRQEYRKHSPNNYRRKDSPRDRSQSRSPRRRTPENRSSRDVNDNRDYYKPKSLEQDQAQSKPQEGERAFDDEDYFRRFKKPPTPCTNCNLWHWMRHCPINLN